MARPLNLIPVVSEIKAPNETSCRGRSAGASAALNVLSFRLAALGFGCKVIVYLAARQVFGYYFFRRVMLLSYYFHMTFMLPQHDFFVANQLKITLIC